MSSGWTDHFVGRLRSLYEAYSMTHAARILSIEMDATISPSACWSAYYRYIRVDSETEQPKSTPNQIMIKCKYCGHWFENWSETVFSCGDVECRMKRDRAYARQYSLKHGSDTELSRQSLKRIKKMKRNKVTHSSIMRCPMGKTDRMIDAILDGKLILTNSHRVQEAV